MLWKIDQVRQVLTLSNCSLRHCSATTFVISILTRSNLYNKTIIESFHAKRAYIAFWVDFCFLQDLSSIFWSESFEGGF